MSEMTGGAACGHCLYGLAYAIIRNKSFSQIMHLSDTVTKVVPPGSIYKATAFELDFTIVARLLPKLAH